MGSERLHDCIKANPDATENDDFQIGKQRLDGYNFFHEDDFTYGHINFTKSI